MSLMTATSILATEAYLLDTSVATIAWDGGHPEHANIRQKLAALGEESISVCAISIGEKEYGLQVSPGADLARRQAVKSAMLQYYNIWPIDHHTAAIYGQLRGGLFKRYATMKERGRLKEKQPEQLIDKTTALSLGIQENDLWIVSVAVQYDLKLISRDRHIQRILDIAKVEFGYDRYEIWSVPTPPPGTS
jgi:tRNA(fMet)-specific endonuclease VapC